MKYVSGYKSNDGLFFEDKLACAEHEARTILDKLLCEGDSAYAVDNAIDNLDDVVLVLTNLQMERRVAKLD